jgi:hypothetical protein
MQPPNWKEVGIPEIMVRSIRDMQATYAMDCLVSQLVFHTVKRLTVSYCCDHCGYTYVPERNNEEVSFCQNCFGYRVRCIQSLKMNAEKKTPYYSRSGNFLTQIIHGMQSNFTFYFGKEPERDIDWEWHDGMYHVAFAGGETGIGNVPRLAICRAALLTPYLWDSMYDWKNNCRRETIEQKFITQYLNHFAIPKKDPYQ